MLQISNLHKHYKGRKGKVIKALDGLSLTMGTGMFGLLGPNGAGKSSLMRTIATLQQPDSGLIEYNGRDIIQDPNHMRSRLGYLPQEFGVYDGVSAYDLMDYLAKLKGVKDPSTRHKQIQYLLEQVNLLEQQDQAVSRFSGGMKQRFGIAQALINDPSIIIVDEPTAGLDPEERNRFHNLLVDISTEKTVLLSTHIVEDIKNLCPELAIIHAGKVIKQGTPEQITKALDGQLWKLETTAQQISSRYKSLNIISQRLYAGKVTIHVLADKQPSPEFSLVKPDLEDAYFASLKSMSNLDK